LKIINLPLLCLLGFGPALVAGVGFGLEVFPTIVLPLGKLSILAASIYYLWPINLRWPSKRDLGRGLVHGAVLCVVPILFLASGGLELLPTAPLKEKMVRIGFLDHFYLLVTLISLANAGFEEWFFRGFIVSQLQRRFSIKITTILGAIFFMPHHFVILVNYMPLEWNLLFTAGTGVAGAYWTYFRARGESLYTLYLSHLICDLIIVGIGGTLLLGL